MIIDRYVIARIDIDRVVIRHGIVRVSDCIVQHRSCLISEGRQRRLVEVGRILDLEPSQFMDDGVKHYDSMSRGSTDDRVVRYDKLVIVN